MRAHEIQSPNKLSTKVFLAGSIEMGKAENWQPRVVEALADKPVIFYNPRRDDWDNTWEQTIDNPDFREQVEWELAALDDADIILMYFDPKTKSPISLLEFGLYARSTKMYVCCPEEFWRKGNIDIVCEKYDITQVDDVDELIEIVKDVFN